MDAVPPVPSVAIHDLGAGQPLAAALADRPAPSPHHTAFPSLNMPSSLTKDDGEDADSFHTHHTGTFPSFDLPCSSVEDDGADDEDFQLGIDGVERDEASWAGNLPAAQGLYDPENEKDACGVGFCASIKGHASHKIVSDGRHLLCNLTHRGATGCVWPPYSRPLSAPRLTHASRASLLPRSADSRDGDGAGIMTGVPHKFLVREVSHIFKHKLPALGHYATGNLFFSPDTAARDEHVATFTRLAGELGLRVLGWREVPTDGSILGPSSKSKEPKILQPFVVLREHYGDGEESKEGRFDEKRFERQLYVLRKHATHTLAAAKWFYICSLATHNLVYKGQLSPPQVFNYFHDLNHVLFEVCSRAAPPPALRAPC